MSYDMAIRRENRERETRPNAQYPPRCDPEPGASFTLSYSYLIFSRSGALCQTNFCDGDGEEAESPRGPAQGVRSPRAHVNGHDPLVAATATALRLGGLGVPMQGPPLPRLQWPACRSFLPPQRRRRLRLHPALDRSLRRPLRRCAAPNGVRSLPEAAAEKCESLFSFQV